jgi:hypothetical protein
MVSIWSVLDKMLELSHNYRPKNSALSYKHFIKTPFIVKGDFYYKRI